MVRNPAGAPRSEPNPGSRRLTDDRGVSGRTTQPPDQLIGTAVERPASNGPKDEGLRRQILARVLLCSALAAVTVSAQAQPTAPAPAGQAAPGTSLNVFLTCPGCDTEFLKTSIGFAEFISNAAMAEVDVTITGPEAADREWRLKFAGRGRFAGRDRALAFSLPATGTSEETRLEIARWLKLGLAEYAVETGAGAQLDVTFRRASTDVPPAAQKDRWNYWVFRVGADTNGNGEQSTYNRSYYFNASANRTTDNWKIRLGGYRSLNRSSFQVSDELTIKTRLSDWSAASLVVKSLGPHLSFGVTASLAGSTFSNQKRVAQFAPGFEYDIFPYRDSTKRSLTIQHTVGGAFYDYETETIFGKLSEKVAQHTLNVSLGLRQPWGQAGSSFVFTQQLTALDRTRLTFFGNLSVRLAKGLTVNGSGSYARIRDQFTLEKGAASEEEVLLRQRQLATGHRYSFSFGFSYSFGALSNVTVNPRFSL